MRAGSISFNWHLFRNTNLTYHDEMWKRRMYLASEIIFQFILACFISFFGHFGPKTYFTSKKCYFYVYVMNTAFKSLKQARKIVYWIISCQRGWLNWILPGDKAPICRIYHVFRAIPVQKNFKILIALHIFWID